MEHDSLHQSLTHQPVQQSSLVNFRIHPNYRSLSVWFDRYMRVVILLCVVFIYLQGATIVHNKSSENVSIPSFIILVIITLSTLMYGIVWTDGFISFVGVLSTTGAIMSLVAATSYRPSTNPGPFSVVNRS